MCSYTVISHSSSRTGTVWGYILVKSCWKLIYIQNRFFHFFYIYYPGLHTCKYITLITMYVCTSTIVCSLTSHIPYYPVSARDKGLSLMIKFSPSLILYFKTFFIFKLEFLFRFFNFLFFILWNVSNYYFLFPWTVSFPAWTVLLHTTGGVLSKC